MRQDHVPGHEDVVDEVEEGLAAQLLLELLEEEEVLELQEVRVRGLRERHDLCFLTFI